MNNITLTIKIDTERLRKDIGSVINEIDAKLENVDEIRIKTDAGDAEKKVEKIGAAIKQTAVAADITRQKLSQWGMIISGVASAITLTRQAIGQIEHLVELSENQELAFKRLKLAFLSSGVIASEQAEKTAKDFAAWASEMQKATNYGDEVIMKSGALGEQLMHLDNHGLKRVTEGAMDLSAAFDQDLQTSIRMIANSVESGIAPFRGASKEMMKMIQSAQTSEERLAIVLRFIKEKFGGTARAMKSDIKTINNTLGDTGETIGKLLAKTYGPLVKILGEILTAFNNLDPALREAIITITGLTAAAVAFSASIGGIPLIIGGIVTALSGFISLVSGMEEQIKTVGSSVLNVKNAVSEVVEQYKKLTAEQLQNKYYETYNRLTGALIDSNIKLARSAKASGITLKEYAEQIGAFKYDFNGTTYYIELTDKQTKSLVAQYQAVLELINARNQQNNADEQNIENSKLLIQTYAEGKKKELAELKLWYAQQKQEHRNNAEALKLIDEIYRAETKKINDKYRMREKRAEQKLAEEIRSLKIKAMRQGEAKELAQLKQWYDKKRQTHKKNEKYQNQLTETYRELRLKIKEKYNRKETENENKNIRRQMAARSRQINLELEAYRNGSKTELEIADKTYNLKKQLLDSELAKELISEKEYQNRLAALRSQKLEAYKQQIKQVSDMLIDTMMETLTTKKRYSDAEIQYNRMQFDKEQKDLKNRLEQKTISYQEYSLKLQMLDKKRADFQLQVEEQNQTLLQRIWKASSKFALKLIIDYLKKYAAQKLAELTITETTEGAKTAAVETGSLARIALMGAEILKKIALAAADIFEGVAAAIGELFATLGPFALLVIGGLVAGAYAAWEGLKNAFGFKTGGYTGDGGADDEAGVVHKKEYVFPAPMVSKEKTNFDKLYRYLASGGTLEKLFNVLAKTVSPDKPPIISSPAIAGFPIAKTSLQSDNGVLKDIKNAIAQIPEKIQLEAQTKITDKEIWLLFKRREKIEQKRTSTK